MPNVTNAGIDDPGGQQRTRPALRVRAAAVGPADRRRSGACSWSPRSPPSWAGLQVALAADQQTSERAAAATVAEQFALRMDKVDGTDFDAYIKGVNELLTTKAKTKNSRGLRRARSRATTAAKVKGTGKVLLTAVGDADADSATVLVVHDAA